MWNSSISALQVSQNDVILIRIFRRYYFQFGRDGISVPFFYQFTQSIVASFDKLFGEKQFLRCNTYNFKKFKSDFLLCHVYSF